MPYSARNTTAALVCRAQSGDARAWDALLAENAGFIRHFASRYTIPGMEHADQEQVARMAFVEVVQSYEGGKGTFRNLAITILERRMRDALKAATRQGRYAEITPISFDAPLVGDGKSGNCLHDVLASYYAVPEKTALAACEPWCDADFIASLSQHQKRVMVAFLRGAGSYSTVATWVGCNFKSVDNALYGIRTKYARYVGEGVSA